MFKQTLGQLAILALIGSSATSVWAQAQRAAPANTQPMIAQIGGGGCPPQVSLVPDPSFENEAARGTANWSGVYNWASVYPWYSQTMVNSWNAGNTNQIGYPVTWTTPHSGVGATTLRYAFRRPVTLIQPISTGDGIAMYNSTNLFQTLTAGKHYYAECYSQWVQEQFHEASSVYPLPTGAGYNAVSTSGIVITNGPIPNPATGNPDGFRDPVPSGPGSGKGHNIFGTMGRNNWSRISGQFVANGDENILSVGVFAGGQAEYNGTGTTSVYSYFMFDDVVLYQIPTIADKLNTCGSVVLGEKCTDMPRATTTYSWSASGDPNFVSANSPYVTVNPASNATYTLTVTLPDGTTCITSALVTRATGCRPAQLSTTSDLFPVPADAELHVRAVENVAATIYNAYGVPVRELKLVAGETVLNSKTLPEGVYYLRYQENGQSVSKRIAIQH